ncbi:MAG: O-antigen ligase family protein [Desulfobulbaceae bacterium]|nr:O-antigen ligase family protein [Desulfobulbaceae bacterium]
MTSLLLLAANMGIAMATALILISGTINIQSLKRLIFTVTVISVAWGLVQAITFHFSGIILALSDAQVSQIIGGFGPGFRTEANTFAKYLNFSFFLFLPTLIKGKLCKKNSLILSVMIVGILLTFTRSAIYGMGATLSFIFIWYIFKSRGTLITRKFLVLFLCGGISIYIFTGFVGNINPYAFYKIQNFFNKEEILEGGSSQFRLMSQKRLIDAFLASDKSIIIGTGWGQVRYIYGGKIWQAGGGELITTLTYGGLFAGLAYLLYLFTSFTAAYKMAQLHRNQEDGLTYEGVAFAVLNSFVTGQINGALIAPEYWLLIGMAMHLSVMPRSTPPQRKLFFGNAVYKKT